MASSGFVNSAGRCTSLIADGIEVLLRACYHAGMCGRYANRHSPEHVARLFNTVNALPNLVPNENAAPK
jgi:hypothetical protein